MLNNERYRDLTDQGDTADLESFPDEYQQVPEPKKESNTFLIKTVSNAINYSAQAISTTGTIVIMAKMLHGLAGAADLANLWQSVGRNAVGGGMVAIAQYSTKEAGNKSLLLAPNATDIEREECEKTIVRWRELLAAGYALTLTLTLGSMTGYGSSYFILPEVTNAETADAAFWYLLISGLGTWPTLASNTIGQTAFIRGYYKSPVFASLGNRISSVAFSWLFVKYIPQLHNTKGVGLGNFLGSLISYLVMERYMRGQMEFAFLPSFSMITLTSLQVMYLIFRRMMLAVDRLAIRLHLPCAELITSRFEALTEKQKQLEKDFSSMVMLWAMMAFQRFSEWGILFVTGLFISWLSSDNSKKTNASVTVIGILALIYQGIGTAGNLTLTTDFRTLESSQADVEAKELAFQKIKSSIRKFLLASLITSLTLGSVVFFTKKYIVNQLADDESQGFTSISKWILDITNIALVGDSMRITASNLLNARYNSKDYNADRKLGSGFHNIILPNLVSLISMFLGTAAGYLIGYLSGYEKNSDDMLACIFYARTVGVFIAAFINTVQLYYAISVDHKKLFPDEVNETYSTRFFAAVNSIKNKLGSGSPSRLVRSESVISMQTPRYGTDSLLNVAPR